MLKIITYTGGLGNQMFQYALFLVLRKKHPFSLFLFDTRASLYHHNGFELYRIFKNNSRIRERLFYALLHRLPRLLTLCKEERERESLKYDEGILKYRGCINYNGFWQTEKYFSPLRAQVLKAFRFNELLLDDKTKSCSSEMKERNSVSIHIRRGDYLQEPFRLTCGKDYYENAIAYIKARVTNPHFYVFSDDDNYVREKFKLGEATFVDWNRGKDSWQDMFLMSKCKYNIIANSSFSWWGAWLNDNDEKIVMAPKIWFRGSYNEDIVPTNWIRL